MGDRTTDHHATIRTIPHFICSSPHYAIGKFPIQVTKKNSGCEHLGKEKKAVQKDEFKRTVPFCCYNMHNSHNKNGAGSSPKHKKSQSTSPQLWPESAQHSGERARQVAGKDFFTEQLTPRNPAAEQGDSGLKSSEAETVGKKTAKSASKHNRNKSTFLAPFSFTTSQVKSTRPRINLKIQHRAQAKALASTKESEKPKTVQINDSEIKTRTRDFNGEGRKQHSSVNPKDLLTKSTAKQSFVLSKEKAAHKSSLSTAELLFRNRMNRLKCKNPVPLKTETNTERKPSAAKIIQQSKKGINQSAGKIKLNLEGLGSAKQMSVSTNKIKPVKREESALKKTVIGKAIQLQSARKVLMSSSTASGKSIVHKKASSNLHSASKDSKSKRQLSTANGRLAEGTQGKKVSKEEWCNLHKYMPSCAISGANSFRAASSKANKNLPAAAVPKTARVENAKPTISKVRKEQKSSMPNKINNINKIIPLSKESLKMLEKIKDSEEIANYIKDHIKKHNKPPDTRIDFYRIGRILGAGAFGKVNLGMHKLTGKLVAIKSIKKAYLKDEESKKKLMQEFSILKNLRHPNIIRLYESFETEKHTLIVMELCSGGDLLNYITKRKRLSEDLAKFVFKALINGLTHCHRHGVLHRDIKLDNVLINTEGELKICDFGVSKAMRKGEVITQRCGTPAYIAPEILKGKGYKGFASDYWSAGVALYAMLYGTVPFKSTSVKDLYQIILKKKIALKDDVSEEARDLLMKLLERNPRRRLSSEEILGHKWMQGIQEMSLFTKEESKTLNKETWGKAKADGKTNTLFSEQNVDSTINELNKNNMTKSIILAPYNSTFSEDQTAHKLDEDCDFIDKALAMKFSVNVKDIDRQFEKNNNFDIDNGVYTKFIFSSKEENKEKDVEEGADNSDSEIGSIDSLDHEVEEVSKNGERMDDLVKEKVDKGALEKMRTYGYAKEYVTKCLNNNELNHATATYYLLTNHYF